MQTLLSNLLTDCYSSNQEMFVGFLAQLPPEALGFKVSVIKRLLHVPDRLAGLILFNRGQVGWMASLSFVLPI